MKAKLITARMLPLAIALTAASIALVHGQTPLVEYVIAGKFIEYVQTGPSTLILNPQPVSANYGGPFGFDANVSGQNMQLLAPPTVTPPAGTLRALGDPFYNTLSLRGNDEWVYGPDGNKWGDISQTAMDTRFPNGTYTFVVRGVSVPLTLTGDVYPNTPQLTLSGGTWVKGKYAMDAANPLTVTTNTFTGYGSNVDGHIGLDIHQSSVELFRIGSPGTNFASLTVPASTLPTNQIINLSASFDAIVSKSNSLPGAYAAAVYGKHVEIEVHILPKFTSQPASQAVPGGSYFSLTVSATGTPDRTTGMVYQWKKDGFSMPGQNNTFLWFSEFHADDAGTYTCTATNAVGTATTQPIVLSLSDAYPGFVSGYGLDLSTTGAPGFDFDNDGVSNLLEYLFGGNPTLPSNGLLPTVTKSGSNLVCTYKRKTAITGVTQVIEHTATLSPPWTPAVHGQGGVSIVTSPVDAATELVTVTIPLSGGSRFLRLKATR